MLDNPSTLALLAQVQPQSSPLNAAEAETTGLSAHPAMFNVAIAVATLGLLPSMGSAVTMRRSSNADVAPVQPNMIQIDASAFSPGDLVIIHQGVPLGNGLVWASPLLSWKKLMR